MGSCHLVLLTTSNYSLFFLLFSRCLGFFLFSPLFAQRGLSALIRLGLACTFTLLLAPPLLTHTETIFHEPLIFSLDIFKELFIGFLIGFLISLLFEAAAFAGQWIGTLMGFSATEILDPRSNSSHPLMATFFSLSLFTLFIALDLHHTLLRFLYGTFQQIPLQHLKFNQQLIETLIVASGMVFKYALNFSLLPLLFLLPLLALFAFISRFFPLFWIGYPIQQLVGLSVLIVSITYFSPILEQFFYDILCLITRIF